MRPRIRSFKPDILHDEELWALSEATRMPVLQGFVGLWFYADKECRFEWRPMALRSLILPYWDGDFERLLEALVDAGMVVKYVVEGRAYGWVRSLKKHQSANMREPQSTLPEPPPDAVMHVHDAAMHVRNGAEHANDVVAPTPPHVHDAATHMRNTEGLGLGLGLGLGSGSGLGVGIGIGDGCGKGDERPAADAAPTSLPAVREVFGEWQRIHEHPTAKLDPKRTSLIRSGLKSFTPDQLRQAIRGALKDEWLMGRDPKSPRKYDGLETILRDTAQIEKLIDLETGKTKPTVRRTSGSLQPDAGRTGDEGFKGIRA